MASHRNIAITATQLEPIQRETVMDMVARRIEQLVRSGDLKQGDRLPPEPELAHMLRVSRNSLREALKGLMYLGLIKSRAGDGTYIQSSLSRVLSQHFQWMILLNEVKHLEIYELRKIIEPDVAALAAKRATRADIERLEAALEGMADARGIPKCFARSIFNFTRRSPRRPATPRFRQPCGCCITRPRKLERQCCHSSTTGISTGGATNACLPLFAITSRNWPGKPCWKICSMPRVCCANTLHP